MLREHWFCGQITTLHSSPQPAPHGPGLHPTLHGLPPHAGSHRWLSTQGKAQRLGHPLLHGLPPTQRELHCGLQSGSPHKLNGLQNPPPPATEPSSSVASPSLQGAASASAPESAKADVAPREISDASAGSAARVVPAVNQTQMIRPKTVVVADLFISKFHRYTEKQHNSPGPHTALPANRA